MNQQSGRSLIEILGVLTIGAVMIAAAGGMYHAIDQRQKRVVALETMKDIVNQTKTLMEYSGSYDKVSIDYLIEAGVLKNKKAPIGSDAWRIKPTEKGFVIQLFKLTYDDCAFFATKNIEWASSVVINNNTIQNNSLTPKEKEEVKPFDLDDGMHIDNGDDTDRSKYCNKRPENAFDFIVE
ncbi:MAG: hypothetical protein J6W27_00210 [Alphaproteobacteria bacterium]|nr:hypothetical protein [Alphaproteobacteria bacterium]